MAKWSESEIYQQTRGKSPWTRFVGWLNNVMNPNHAWKDYESSPEVDWSNSLTNQITREDLTGAEKAANLFNAAEAEKQRAWETEMQNTVYQRQVTDMQKAGINPALAMSGGQPATPSGASAQSVSPSGASMNMSDLMQALLLPMNRNILKAQAKNIQADTDKKIAETKETEGKIEQLRLINQYYPQVTEASLDKMASEIGLTREQINKTALEADLVSVDTIIRRAEADHASAFYKARADYESAHGEEARANAAAAAARAAWDEFETSWTKSHNGARPSASATLALVSAITSWLGIQEDGIVTGAVAGAIKKKVDEVGGLIEDPAGTIKTKGKEIDDKLAPFRERVRRFRNWVDKPKKAPWVK